jgi:hypothetical protein
MRSRSTSISLDTRVCRDAPIPRPRERPPREACHFTRGYLLLSSADDCAPGVPHRLLPAAHERSSAPQQLPRRNRAARTRSRGLSSPMKRATTTRPASRARSQTSSQWDSRPQMHNRTQVVQLQRKTRSRAHLAELNFCKDRHMNLVRAYWRLTAV